MFYGCKSLRSITLPASIKTIGTEAFKNCKGFTSFTIPNTVVSIGKDAFASCTGITNFTIEDGDENLYIDGNIFSANISGTESNLSKIYIGRNIIGKKLCQYQTELTSVTFSDKVRLIPSYAFFECSSLKSIILPNNLESIGEYAFCECESLSSISLPHSLNSIGISAFEGCTKISSINIPSGVRLIPDDCFNICSALKTVTIENGVTSIGNNAIPYSLDNILILPPSITSIGKGNFGYRSKIILFNGNLTWNVSENSGDFYILDNKIPTFSSDIYQYADFYVCDKENFVKQTNVNPEHVHQLNEDIVSVSLNYTGLPQGPDRSSLSWPIGDFLNGVGISYSFGGIQNTDCGHWVDTEKVTFSYNNWSVTSDVFYDYIIKPIPLKVSVQNCTRLYGDENPQFGLIVDGLVESDKNINVLEDITFSTEATNTSSVGDYTIIPNAKAKNYELLFTNGTLTISRAPLKVAINDTERIYGDINPLFSLSYSGLKNEDQPEDVIIKQPQFTTKAEPGSSVGTYTVSASGIEANNYFIEEYIDGQLTIKKANLTLQSKNTERIYGEDNPDFDFELQGFKNGDDKLCLTTLPQYKCEASITSDCGDYTITPYGASAQNYEISYLPGTLTINKAPLNIGVKDCSRLYGDANPKFEFIYSGFKGGDDASVLTVLPSASCNAKTVSPVGYYDIELSGAEAANYDISYTPGILTVEAAPLTIRPKNVSRMFGKPNPDFELLYLGFKNDDDANVLSRLPQVSTTATKQSPVGDYPINVSDAAAQNYAIEYEPGVLTVTKNILKARGKDVTRIYGDENPQFSVEYSGFLNGDTENVVSPKPQFLTEADRTSKVGTYEVSAYGASSPNYEIEYQNGKLTITPRQISAIVGNYSRSYGSPNPQFKVEYDGLMNGDDETAITEPTIATCEANLQSGVGNYQITLSGGRGENYEVTSFTNGVLTVEKANQTIEWNQDLSSVNQYDQIELTATASSGLPITYEVASNNVVDIYTSGGKTFLDCYGTGTVTIRATQNGNENYYPSETITNRITVMSEGGFVDPSNPEISIHVTTPGTLSSKIAASKKYQIKSLTVSGTLNGTDIRYLREMAGRDVNGNKTTGILEKLNLSRATIESGGDYYYTTNSYTSGRKFTSNNQISDYMFYGCSTLTNLALPQNSTEIGTHAFDECLNLSNIIMPDGVLSIGAYAFNGDISLSRISIPEQTTIIGDYAFQNCTGLTTLILSSSVKTIGNGMLNGCSNIQEITLNNSNEYYSTLNGVLYDNKQTSLIIYPAGKQLQTFEAPDGVTEIKNSGFYGTTALKYLFLPESLTTVGEDAFKCCGNLTKLFSRAITPPECVNDCFEAVSKSNCTLYVPKGSRNAYWAAPVWGEFLSIIESNDLSVGGNTAKPDYGFEFTETTLSKGKCTYIPVSMNNVDPVVAFNCDIVLPEGVKLYEDASGQIIFKTSERFPTSQMIDSRIQANGDIRIISTSSSNEAFSGTDGILFYIPLFITDPNAGLDSEYNLIFKNIEFTRKNQSGYSSVNSPDINVTLTVGRYTMGDANGDGRITSVDAVIAKGYFLGDDPADFIFKAADMNFDGKISSVDIVLITDEFLTQNQKSIAKAKGICDYQGHLRIVDVTKSSTVLSVELNLPDAYRFTAVQMDITIPDGFNIKDLKVGDDNQTSHVVRYYQHPNGLTRIFISSDNNDNFTSDNLLSLELEEENNIHYSQEIVVDDVLAVEISGRDYLEISVEGSSANISDTSQISNQLSDDKIEIWAENAVLYIKSASDGMIYLYDIAGHTRQIEINSGITSIPVVPGIYIINNQKIIIK